MILSQYVQCMQRSNSIRGDSLRIEAFGLLAAITSPNRTRGLRLSLALLVQLAGVVGVTASVSLPLTSTPSARCAASRFHHPRSPGPEPDQARTHCTAGHTIAPKGCRTLDWVKEVSYQSSLGMSSSGWSYCSSALNLETLAEAYYPRRDNSAGGY